jgi:hypothetical protein
MAAGDWSALKADTTNAVPRALRLQLEPALAFDVGVRRKRLARRQAGHQDRLQLLRGRGFQSLKKLSLGGISGSGEVERCDLLAEYRGGRWSAGRHFVARGVARLYVNGARSAYIDVSRSTAGSCAHGSETTPAGSTLSGSSGDGYKTNSGTPNPFEQALCFLTATRVPCRPRPSCSPICPRTDIDQICTSGGQRHRRQFRRAQKDSNYYFYDWQNRASIAGTSTRR